MVDRVRSVAFVGIYLTALTIMMVIFLPVLVLPRRALIAISKLWSWLFRFLIRLIMGIEVVIEGTEHIPQGGAIIAAKHQSTLDVFAMLGAVPDPAFVLKRSLTYLPLFGWYAWKFRCVPVDRGRGRETLIAMIPPAKQVISDSRQLIIYPEGTRRPPGAPAKYKHGVSFLYQQTNAPIVPVALNTGLYWGRNSWQLNRGQTIIRFLPPIEPGLDQAALMARLEQEIESETNKLIDQAVRRNPQLADQLPPGWQQA